MRAFEILLLAGSALSLVTTILNILFTPRLKPVTWTTAGDGDGPRPAWPLPTVSIIVPARNEERTIEQTVRALLAQTYAPLEVIVVNDRSSDRTGAILDSIAGEDPRLVVVHGEEPPAGWLGKPWALHEGSRRARGELLLFVDADIQYAPATVATLVAYFERRGVSMVALVPKFEMHGFWENVGLTQLPLTGFCVVPVWLSRFTTLVELGIGGGPGNLVSRAAFEEMGGYETLKNAVIDDVGMARQLRRRGHRTDVILGDRLASLRMYHGLHEVIDGFTKNLFATFGGNFLAGAFILIVMLAFGLGPYVLAVFGEPLAIAAAAIAILTRLLIFAYLGYRLDVAIVGQPLTTIVWSWILIRSMRMVGLRRQIAWRGRTYEKNWTRFGSKR